MEEIKIIVDDCSKVVVNGIEITSVEDWNKVMKSLNQLQQYKQQIDELIKKYERKVLEQTKVLSNLFDDDQYEYEISLKDEIRKYQEVVNDLSKLKEHDKESL